MNGSFELGPLVGRGIEDFDIFAGETDIVGWTVLGGGVDYMNAPWGVADGIHAVDLDLRNSIGGIEQTFTTVVGQEYLVSFQLSGNPDGPPVMKRMRVSVDGFSRDYSHDSSGQIQEDLVWQWHEFSFIASSSSATLRFFSLADSPNSYGPMIDDVRVSAVPEPRSLGLLALGLVLAGCRRAIRLTTRLPIGILAPLTIASLLGWSAPASADIITISSESFAIGVDVSHALEGATLQRLEQTAGMNVWTPVRSPVITAPPDNGPLEVSFGRFVTATFNYDCAHRNGQPSQRCLGQTPSMLEVTFDTPVPYVSIVGDFGDEPVMYAYDSEDRLLMSCAFGSMPGCTTEWFHLFPGQSFEARSTITIERTQADIARVAWGGGNGRAYANRISYSVPEPGTLLLVTIGLVGACGNITRRRFKRI